jgi:hypothetical protein
MKMNCDKLLEQHNQHNTTFSLTESTVANIYTLTNVNNTNNGNISGSLNEDEIENLVGRQTLLGENMNEAPAADGQAPTTTASQMLVSAYEQLMAMRREQQAIQVFQFMKLNLEY